MPYLPFESCAFPKKQSEYKLLIWTGLIFSGSLCVFPFLCSCFAFLLELLFPTCQVRVVRFYVSWHPSPPSRSPRRSHLNREPRLVVFPAGPQLQASAGSVHRWPSNASLRRRTTSTQPQHATTAHNTHPLSQRTARLRTHKQSRKQQSS